MNGATDAEGWAVVRARAPLRISFAGGGSDILEFAARYGGAVVSTTIARFAYASLWRGSRCFQVDLPNLGISEVIDPHVAAAPALEFARLALGNAAGRFGGRVELWSECPAGSGLGASSALIVALVAARRRFLEGSAAAAPHAIAVEAYETERVRLGIQGGMQDQFAAACGGFNFITFDSLERVRVQRLTLSDALRQELRYRSLLVATGATRASGGILERQIGALRRPASEALTLVRQIRDLAYEARAALECGSIDDFARTVDAGWRLKRQVDGAISTSEIDGLCDGLKAHGAAAVKLLGAGGGGYVLAIAAADARPALQRYIEGLGVRAETFDYEDAGVRAWCAREREPALAAR